MEFMHSAVVRGQDGWSGTVLPSTHRDPTHVYVQLESGGHYLVPAECLIPQEDGSLYVPLRRAELVPVPRADALGRLMEECLALSRRLNRENVAEIVRWIETIDCYALTFQSLDEAAELVSHLALDAHA